MLKLDDNIKLTVMAVREYLMLYYKNSNSNERLVGTTNVRINYHHSRDRTRNDAMVYISNIPLFSLTGDDITFHNTLNRSPQLREVKSYIETFMETYLPAIERKYSDAYITAPDYR